MNTYDNEIYNLLINNLGITVDEWFEKSEFSSQNDFSEHIKMLRKERVIKRDYNYKELYSPRQFKLMEYSNEYDVKVNEFYLSYIPENILKNELGYFDLEEKAKKSFEQKVQHSGFQITEKNRLLIESNNDIKLDFENFNYKLFVKYPNARFAQDIKKDETYNIIYIQSKINSSNDFIVNLKNKYVPGCSIHEFDNIVNAFEFLENAHKRGIHIHSIVTENSTEIDAVDLINALIELKIEKSRRDILFTTIPIVLSPKNALINKKSIKKFKGKSYLELSEDVDEYILGNIVKNYCKDYSGGYFHFTLR